MYFTGVLFETAVVVFSFDVKFRFMFRGGVPENVRHTLPPRLKRFCLCDGLLQFLPPLHYCLVVDTYDSRCIRGTLVRHHSHVFS